MNRSITGIAIIAGVLLGAAWLATRAPSPVQASRSPAPSHAAPPLTSVPKWQDELVDQLGLVGAASAIALDGNGYAHISYYDFTSHALKYAAWDGVAWTVDTVETDLGVDRLVRTDYPLRSTIALYGGTAYLLYEKYDAATGRRFLRDVFALTTAGRRYINLYYQYGPQTGALALSDPALLWDAYRTLQNLLPGFKALAAGHGGDFVITQGMVDEVNNVADRLVAAAQRRSRTPSTRSAQPTTTCNYSLARHSARAQTSPASLPPTECTCPSSNAD